MNDDFRTPSDLDGSSVDARISMTQEQAEIRKAVRDARKARSAMETSGLRRLGAIRQMIEILADEVDQLGALMVGSGYGHHPRDSDKRVREPGPQGPYTASQLWPKRPAQTTEEDRGCSTR